LALEIKARTVLTKFSQQGMEKGSGTRQGRGLPVEGPYKDDRL